MTTEATKGGPGTALQKEAPSPGVAKYDPELAALAGEFAGQGSQDATQADRQTPFLGLIQGLSPQLKRDKDQYLPDAKQGDIFNSVTGELFPPVDDDGKPAGLLVIPVFFQKVYNVWIDRDDGGGFLGSYRDKECTDPIFVSPMGAEGTDKHTDVIETANWWVLAQSADGVWMPAIVSMKSTALKASRKWMTLVTMASNKFATSKGPAPMFLRTYRLTSVSETNQSGDFYNWKAEDLDFATVPLIKMAAELRKLILEGVLRAEPAKEAAATGGDEPPEAEAPAAAGKGARPKF